MVRVKGLRITDLIEQAIKDSAEQTTVGRESKNWLHYWHPHDGVRLMNLIFDPDIHTSFEEDEIRDFIEQHKDFFYRKEGPINVFVQVLWPKINDYMDHWRNHKATDRWATGKLMLEAINAAGLNGPSWPPTSPPSSRPEARPKPRPIQDLDDEIPF
jgi:hypothetical protein